MRLALALVLLGCGSAAPPAAPPPPSPGEELLPPHHYRLEAAGDVARMTLWLPPRTDATRVDLVDVAGRDGRRAQIADVRCDDAPVEANPAGWELPAGCRVLRWIVRFEAIESFAPTEPRAVRDGERGLFLLPGAAAFLVPDGTRERGTVDIVTELPTYHRLPDADRLGLELPAPPHLARVVIAFGPWVERSTSDGATSYRHLFDREPAHLDLAAFGRLHAQGAAYLSRLTGTRPPAAVDLVWVRGEAVQGALGADVTLLSYVASDDHEALLVVLREQLRMLATGHLPEWATETLFGYYARKALAHAGAITAEELAAWVEARPEGDRARLWHDLDRAIAEASGGERSLDDALEAIVTLVFVDGGLPPRRFLDVLREAGLEDPSAITRAHLDWPPS